MPGFSPAVPEIPSVGSCEMKMQGVHKHRTSVRLEYPGTLQAPPPHDLNLSTGSHESLLYAARTGAVALVRRTQGGQFYPQIKHWLYIRTLHKIAVKPATGLTCATWLVHEERWAEAEDLVLRENAHAWLGHIRTTTPTPCNFRFCTLLMPVVSYLFSDRIGAKRNVKIGVLASDRAKIVKRWKVCGHRDGSDMRVPVPFSSKIKVESQ
ncbi:hypothetical protein H4582DRAFT_2066227 [Lactarius indigo]|nr:hypothetical protein H4582DRAFT_2066227 [Lactarius indigo]